MGLHILAQYAILITLLHSPLGVLQALINTQGYLQLCSLLPLVALSPFMQAAVVVFSKASRAVFFPLSCAVTVIALLLKTLILL